jgi:hypothetical protein
MGSQMARRIELKGICNDLLTNFVSRYNDLEGFWALGKFQKHLQGTNKVEFCIDLLNAHDSPEKRLFSTTFNYYRDALQRHMAIRNMPVHWLKTATINISALSRDEIVCAIKIKTDLGRFFTSSVRLSVRPHDPAIEHRRMREHFGPSI